MNTHLVGVGHDGFCRAFLIELDRSKSANRRIKRMSFPPLGIHTFSSALRPWSHPVQMFDTGQLQMKAEHIARVVARAQPGVLALPFLSTSACLTVRQDPLRRRVKGRGL